MENMPLAHEKNVPELSSKILLGAGVSPVITCVRPRTRILRILMWQTGDMANDAGLLR